MDISQLMEKPNNYKGIKFVRLSLLPEDEAFQIKDWAESRKITILTESEMWRDCLEYRFYKEWYENHYSPNSNGQDANGQSKKEPLAQPSQEKASVFSMSQILKFVHFK